MILNKRKLCDDLTRIVGSGLHYYENSDSLDLNTCEYTDILNLQDGWINRYRSEPIFHARVESLVANLMQVMSDSQE